MVKILLAEDDKDLNALICARLTQEGYEAIPCADGQEAWETLENCAADLVITDIMMPRWTISPPNSAGSRSASTTTWQSPSTPIC